MATLENISHISKRCGIFFYIVFYKRALFSTFRSAGNHTVRKGYLRVKWMKQSSHKPGDANRTSSLARAHGSIEFP
ncbi:MAG: hypothetical protein ABSG75_17400 [Syntrophales bacterium]